MATQRPSSHMVSSGSHADSSPSQRRRSPARQTQPNQCRIANSLRVRFISSQYVQKAGFSSPSQSSNPSHTRLNGRHVSPLHLRRREIEHEYLRSDERRLLPSGAIRT